MVTRAAASASNWFTYAWWVWGPKMVLAPSYLWIWYLHHHNKRETTGRGGAGRGGRKGVCGGSEGGLQCKQQPDKKGPGGCKPKPVSPGKVTWKTALTPRRW